MQLDEKTIRSETVYAGRVFTVKHDTIELPDGREATRDIVEHNGGVCVAAIDESQNIYLVDQFRYAFHRVLTEVPAGKLERGEDPAEAARRELREETGLLCDSLEKLGVIYPTTGYCSEQLHLFLATGLTRGEQALDEDEFLNCKTIPLADALAAVYSNAIHDAKTVATILLAVKRLEEK